MKTRRPPIITIMGHVDHGKTTLMDYIQKSNMVEGEAGGITQTIKAFHVDHKGHALTFIDTPGHAAFQKMRERGSKLSDIILLVVAADDGVKPQTKEVIDLALRDKIPLVIAINKVDLPNADITRVKTELAKNGVLLEGWGGSTVNVEVSAKTGAGVENLLDMIELVAEVEDLSDEAESNNGIVLESYMQKNTGPESVIIIKSGEVAVGDFIGGDGFYGKIRALIDDQGKRIQKATVSMPVRILGLEKVLQSGEALRFSSNKKEIEEVLDKGTVQSQETSEEEIKSPIQLLEDLMQRDKEKGSKPELNVILKTDFVGTLEAIMSAFENNKNENVSINIIRTGTGEINESDISHAKSVRAVVIGFNAPLSARVKTIAQNEKVIIMNYSIIYELIDDVMSAAESLIPPEAIEVYIGSADVMDTFKLSNGSYVGGSIVKDGKLIRGYHCYVTRGDERVFTGKLSSIRYFKEEVKEALKGKDCGISVAPNFEFQKGDKITCIRIEKS